MGRSSDPTASSYANRAGLVKPRRRERAVSMPRVSQELVTVAHYGRAWEAELMRGHLRAHGIESVLEGTELATMQSLRLGTLLDIRLQVHASDAVAAARLVAEHDAEHVARGGRPPPEACLACGAPLPEKARECPACHWTWELRGHRPP